MENTGLEVFGTKEVSVKEFMGGTDKSLMLLESPILARGNLVALHEKHEARVVELVSIEKLSPAELKELNSIRGELREPRYFIQKIEKNNTSVFETYKKTDKANLKGLIDINKSLEDKADEKIKLEEERKKNEKAEEERIERERVGKIKAKIELFETDSYRIIQETKFDNVEYNKTLLDALVNSEFDYEEYDILFEQARTRVQTSWDSKCADINEKEEQRKRNEELEKQASETKRLSELQATRLTEIMSYIAFGEAVDLTKLSELDDDVYKSILDSKKALFEADEKTKQDAKKLADEKVQEEKEAVYEIRKKRLLDAGMKYSHEHETLWLDEDLDYILLTYDVANYSALEFEETFSEVQKIIQDAKDKIEKENVFEIRKNRLLELEPELDLNIPVSSFYGYTLEEIYNADIEGFEVMVSDSKKFIDKRKSDAEESLKQKALDEQKSKEDAELLKNENKERVKRLAGDKKVLTELIQSLEFRNAIPELINEEMQGFLDGIIEGLNNTKSQLLTELEKL